MLCRYVVVEVWFTKLLIVGRRWDIFHLRYQYLNVTAG